MRFSKAKVRCSNALEAMSGIDGHQASYLHEDVNKARSYLIVSEWNDASAFQAFIGSEEFARVTNWGQEQVLAGPPRHQIYGA